MHNYEIFDAHCDTLCRVFDRKGDIRHNQYNTDIERMLRYKGYTQIFACYISPDYYNSPKDRLRSLLEVYKLADFSGITPLLSIEGGEVIESLEDVDFVYDAGVRCVNLTWNYSNQLAGGVLDSEQGLTPLGRDVVKRLNNYGIFIDVSHLNDKSFYEVADIVTMPLVATHSNSRTICANPRNLTDDMFGIIRDMGGCVGINLYPPFVNGDIKCTIDEVIGHIEHFMSLNGEDEIGIGADFDGTDDLLPRGISGCEDLYKLLDELSKRGYNRHIVEKFSHKNFKRVFGG